MSTFTDSFEQAQLSMAAYALNLQSGMFGASDTNYTDALEHAGMSSNQAEAFAQEYTVIDQYADPVTGFAGTVFEKDGNYYFAMRGTEPNEFVNDVVNADLGEIGFDGLAFSQALSMYNWLQRLLAAPGSEIMQYLPVPEGINGYEIVTVSVTVSANSQSGETLLNGLVGDLSVGGESPSVTVTGHSLGGHLAMIMGRLAPNLFDATFTYNAPNFDPLPTASNTSEGFFEYLSYVTTHGGTIPESGAIGSSWGQSPPITSWDVEGDIIHVLGDYPEQPGTANIIYAESANQGPYDAHLKEPFTDALALYSLFEKVDPNVSLDTITDILKASQPPTQEGNTLERVLSDLGLVFGQSTSTLAGDRNTYYTNILALGTYLDGIDKTGMGIQSLYGMGGGELADLARTDLAYRYALENLDAFVVTGNPALYQAQNANGFLDTENFSDQYHADRSEFMYWYLRSNADSQGADNYNVWPGQASEPTYYKDVKTGYELWVGGTDISVRYRDRGSLRQVIFGSGVNDALVGGDEGDHLYGREGADALIGGAGADWLEGGLLGDNLIGGVGDDHLEGGSGDDVYVYRTGDGIDTIIDVDGSIQYDGIVLTGGAASQTDANTFVSDDGRFTYTRVETASGTDLWINNIINIQNYHPGDLGIVLGDPAESPVEYLNVYLPDLIHPDSPHLGHIPGSDGVGRAWSRYLDFHKLRVIDSVFGITMEGDRYSSGPDEYGIYRWEFVSENIIAEVEDWEISTIGGIGGDRVVTGAGSDRVSTVPLRPYIDGVDSPDDPNIIPNTYWISVPSEAGPDYVDTGAGRDAAGTGGGDDTLIMGSGQDIAVGGDGNDNIDGGTEGDLLSGGAGNDFMQGGSGDDVLFGDTIHVPYEDFENDWRLWDFSVQHDGNGNFDTTLTNVVSSTGTEPEGNDILYGGQGLDILLGEGGDDFLSGDEGVDALVGGSGNDLLMGGEDDDWVWGDDWEDATIAGHDILLGEAGVDHLFGGAGDDVLFGGEGDDQLKGDDMRDNPAVSGNDALYGEAGNDELIGGSGDDYLDGGDGADSLFGDQDERFPEMVGNDTLVGGAGDDYLDGGPGSDVLLGGEGDDIYVVDNAQDVVIEHGNEGIDVILASSDFVLPDNVEHISLLDTVGANASGNALANRLFGSSGSNVLEGLAGDDFLFGRAGSDTLNGGVGADRLFGEDGNDRLDGGAQNDALYGGAGDDVYVALLGGGEDVVVDLAGANAIEFGAGITQGSLNLVHYQADDGAQYLRINYGPNGDALLIRDGLTGTIQQYRFSDGSTLTHEALIGQSPAALQIDGSSHNDVIHGSDQADRIDAGLGDDQVFGAAGADTLMGGQGADTLDGGAGNDTLEGGIGDDTLIGGAGEDRYVLQWGMGSDLIIEQGAEQSTLALGNGVQLSDLAIWIDRDDLLVRFAGGDSGVRIQGYGAAPLSWRIEDESGVVHRLDDMASQPPSTATPLNFVEVSASFIDTVRATFIETLTQPGETTGYAMDADGVLRKVNSYIADDYAATVHESAHIAVEDVAADGDTYSQTTSGFSSEFSFSQASIRVATLTAAAGSVGGMAGYGASTATYHSFGSGAGYQIPSGAGVVTVYGPSVDQDGGQNIQLDSYTAEVGTSQPIGVWVFGDGAATGIPSVVPHDISHRDDTLTLTRVTGGAGDNAIAVDGHAIVDGGDGNDLIVATAVRWDISYGQYFVPEDPYTLTVQFDDRNVGALLYGNSGTDQIAGGAANDLLIGGGGDDIVDGRAGEDVYVVRRGESGYDIIADSGTSVSINYETGASRYADWYYRSLGMPDYVDRLLRGETLPPLPPLSPNDLDAMAQLAQSGIIETDTVEFSEGISLDQLVVSWGEVVLNSPVLPESQPWMDEQGLRFRTLDISWAEGEGVRIVIPHTYVSPPPYEDDVPMSAVENFSYDRSDETLGLGIERFRFADGSTLSMADMVALAPPSPSFDPHLQDPDMMLTGTTGDDMLAGGDGNDTLDGLDGADQMSGGAGDDVYYVDNPGDVVSEGAGAGTDTVNSSISYSLTTHVEHLTLTGADAIDGAGNALSNTLTGNESANVLKGEAGDDTLRGMAGDDILNGGDGNDLLETGYGFDYAYGGAGNDTITGGNNVPGGWLPEYLYGEEGDDLLIGGGKYAHLYGGAGNDELRGGAGYQNLYGEDGDDLLIAGALGYMLDGGAGADRMVGSANNNTYGVDNILDVIVELPGGGTDTVNSSITYVLSDNLENLILVGSVAISGTGNSGNNTLNGSLNAAANTLAGGLGDDTYVIGAGDVIVEQPGEGIDSVNVATSYTLGDNLENLTLTSSFADNGTGNALDNRLVGNGYNNTLSGLGGNDYLSGGYGNDTLNGGAGIDEMLGGYGNDIYYVDNSGDLVTELAGQGTDTVYSSISYTLGSNVERLTLTGAAVISAIGNTLANILTGNGASNLLIGDAGNDTLRGMGGNDWLLGGAGNDAIEGGDGADILFGSVGNDTVAGGWGSDQYTFARGDGQDVVNDYDARDADPATYGQTTDAVQFGADIAHDQLWFTRLGNDLQVQVIGTSDRISVQNWYLGGAYQVEELHAGNGYSLLNTQVEQLVQAMAAFAPPASGELSLSASYRQELEPVIAANWQSAA